MYVICVTKITFNSSTSPLGSASTWRRCGRGSGIWTLEENAGHCGDDVLRGRGGDSKCGLWDHPWAHVPPCSVAVSVTPLGFSLCSVPTVLVWGSNEALCAQQLALYVAVIIVGVIITLLLQSLPFICTHYLWSAVSDTGAGEMTVNESLHVPKCGLHRESWRWFVADQLTVAFQPTYLSW